MWFVQLCGQLVTWTNSVTAQWIITAAGESPAVIAAVTGAAALPAFLFSMIAGAVADVVDRRRMLLVVQPLMTAVAVAIAALSFLNLVSPPLLIISTFLLGTGAAFSNPAITSAMPGVIRRELVLPAMSLISINANAARIAGPVLAGVLLTVAGAAAAFLSSVVVLLVSLFAVSKWPVGEPSRAGRGISGAIRTGIGYVRFSPPFRAVLWAGAGFVVPATSVWALSSVVAHDRLHLGGDGYGALFSCLGAGAIVAGLLAPRIQRLNRPALLLLIVSLAYAAATVVLAVVRDPFSAVAALLVIGAGWMLGANTIMIACQVLLPDWVRGRGIAAWYTILFGGQAFAALLWGVIAEYVGPELALIVAAVLMLAVAIASFASNTPAVDLGEGVAPLIAESVPDPRPDGLGEGPLAVTIDYVVQPENTAAFEAIVPELGRSRRRTGSRRWRLLRDAARPGVYVEVFELDSWSERELQTSRRRHAVDADVTRRIGELAVDFTVHYLSPIGRSRDDAGGQRRRRGARQQPH